LLFAVFAEAQEVVLEGPTKLEVNITTQAAPSTVISTTEKESLKGSLSVDSGEANRVSPLPESTFTLLKGASNELAQVEPAEKTPAKEESTAELDAKIEFLMDIGMKFIDEGDYSEAEQAYLRALQKNTNNAPIRFALSALYLKMERYKEAAELLNIIKEEYPYHPIILNNLAWLYATGGEMRNNELALLYAREAILSTPFNPNLWNTLAEAYYLGGDYSNAQRSSTYAMELLQKQGDPEKKAEMFRAQQIKILRAYESFKRLYGTDDVKTDDVK
jgi:tetratricopeptide (TPR) repeat protein